MKATKIFKVGAFLIPNTKSTPEARRGIVHFAETHPSWDLCYLSSAMVRNHKSEVQAMDGFIITTWPRATPRLLQRTTKPVVFIDPPNHFKQRPNRCEHFICDAKIGAVAAQHLLSTRRCRSFAFAPPMLPRGFQPIFVTERRDSFTAVLRANGFSCQTLPAGEEADILRSLTPPVGIFAATDARAAELVHLVRRLNFHLPEDAMILGVDNDELICEHQKPALSSIDVDFAASAYHACRTLDILIRGSQVPSQVVSDVSVRVVARVSTAAPNRAGRLVTRAQELVRARAASGLTAQAVAKELGVSRQLLALRIKEATGTTLQVLIAEHRFNRVLHLLRQTSKPLKVIADECGFKNLSHFMTAFRRRYGKTPSACR